jgi:uncharacterized membrane protein HdeD (DUF308 family)
MDFETTVEGQPLAVLHRLRGWFTAAGVALIALGVMAVALPFVFTLAFDYAIGALLVIGGAVHGFHAFQARRWTGAVWRLVVAALYVVAGVLIVVHPLTGALALTLILSAFLLAAGVTRLVLAYHLHPHAGWGWTLTSGVLSVLLGGLLFIGWPSTAFWAIGLYVGVDLLFAGWSLVSLAFVPRVPIGT